MLDFRIGEERQAFLTKNMGRVSERREALMVAPGEEWTDLALYLSDEVLAGAENFSTQDRRSRMHVFCLACLLKRSSPVRPSVGVILGEEGVQEFCAARLEIFCIARR